MISRSNVAALIPEEHFREIVQEMPHASVVMQLARRLPDMSRAQTRMPVMAGLANAAFVNGDTGQKQTTDAEWENVYLNAEEIAVIVPIPEAVLDDADYDIFGEIRPQISEAFGSVFDLAVLHGDGKPASWPDAILTQAAAATGHLVDLSTVEGAGGDLYDALLGPDGVWAAVENDGFGVTGAAALQSLRGKLRGLRDTTGQPIFKTVYREGMQGATQYELDGTPLLFRKNVSEAEADNTLLIAGDWSKLVYSVRQEMTYKILDQAVIQDAVGNIKYNLAQQDMVALRCVMRIAWALPNPASRVQPNKAQRLPFAALVA